MTTELLFAHIHTYDRYHLSFNFPHSISWSPRHLLCKQGVKSFLRDALVIPTRKQVPERDVHIADLLFTEIGDDKSEFIITASALYLSPHWSVSPFNKIQFFSRYDKDYMGLPYNLRSGVPTYILISAFQLLCNYLPLAPDSNMAVSTPRFNISIDNFL